MKQLIQIPHHKDDYECMWNGIEDMYMNESKQQVPSFFFFCISGIGTVCYAKHQEGLVKRQLMLSDGRTDLMYQSICNTVGFAYSKFEGTSFSNMLAVAKEEINAGYPLVLGCLDMYHLPYYKKFYHATHIPIHYVLMVGYEEEQEQAYVYDCGLSELQTISFVDLEQALAIAKTSLGDKNGLYKIRFRKKLPDVYMIAKSAFAVKADTFLHPATDFLGRNGLLHASKEFDSFYKLFAKEEREAILREFVLFAGTVPKLPNVLLRVNEPESVLYQGAREKLANVLITLGTEYANTSFVEAGKYYAESGRVIEHFSEQMIDVLLHREDWVNHAEKELARIALLEEKANLAIVKGC